MDNSQVNGWLVLENAIITSMTSSEKKINRKIKPIVAYALGDTRVVAIQGARQTGKSTLAMEFVHSGADQYLTLDAASIRESARANPADFVRQAPDGLLVIDEIQRVPELILEIKNVVDSTTRPGQFLITGSSDLSALYGVQESLAGRMERIELMPFSQQEISSGRASFVHEIFEEEYQSKPMATSLIRQDYLERALAGGYPEAVKRSSKLRRDTWFDNYLKLLFEQRATEDRRTDSQLYLRFISYLASISGREVVIDNISSDMQLKRYGVEQIISELQKLFLIEVIPAWSTNLTKRAIKHPKVFLKDAGVTARLLRVDATVTTDITSPVAGLLFESFIFNELMRTFKATEGSFEFFHYRDTRKREVDLVIEDDKGRILLIEVRASSTVRAADFHVIDYLMKKHPEKIVRGLVVYTGSTTLPFGEKQLALPAHYLWE